MSGAELCEVFESLGLEDVAAFRTSGNVVFEAPRDMTAKLESELETKLGYDVGVFLRTEKQVRAIAEHEPFPRAQGGKLQVTLLAKKPAAGVKKKVLALATKDDRLAFGERELYWLPKAGTQTSKLDTDAIAKLLDAPTTMRTKGTIEQLWAKYFSRV